MNRQGSNGVALGKGHWAGSERTRDDGPSAALAGIAAAARRSAAPLGLWVLACLLAGAWVAHSTPASYTATATVILDARQQPQPAYDAAQGGAAGSLDSAQADSQLQVLRSERLLTRVFEARRLAADPELRPAPPGRRAVLEDWVGARLGAPPRRAPEGRVAEAIAFSNFSGRVSARRVGMSYVIEVSYVSGDPATARDTANSIVSAYLGQQVAAKAARASTAGDVLQARETALKAEVAAADVAVNDGGLPTSPMPDADARIIGAALLPLSKSAPQTGLIVAFAGAFGLLAGLGAVAVRTGLDRRVRTAAQIRRETGFEYLGGIPSVDRWSTPGWSGAARRAAAVDAKPDSRFASAIRDVRTTIMLHTGNEEGHRVVAFVSWRRGDGATLVASNVARTMAQSGLAVTLVDADLQGGEAALTALCGASGTGLTEALFDPSRAGDVAPAALAPHLGFVASRSDDAEPDPRAFLGSPGLRALVDRLAAEGSVIVDLPPLSTSKAARAVASVVSGVVLVAEAGRTTRDDLESAMDALGTANVLGVVLNRVR